MPSVSFFHFPLSYARSTHPPVAFKESMKDQWLLEPDMEQQSGSKLGEECVKAVCHHPAYLTYLTSYEMPGWMKCNLESRLPGEISTTSDMQMTPPLWQKWRETKEALDEGETGQWKIWLKAQHSENEDHGIRSHHFTGEKWKQWQIFFSWAPNSMWMVTVTK